MTIEYTEANLKACQTAALMQDCDEDVWGKNPDGSWSVLDGDGIPAPVSHSAAFLVEQCSPLAFLGTSERLQTYFANQGVQKAAEAVSEPVKDWTPPSVAFLYELVKEGRYHVWSDTNFETFEEGLRYGCKEHPDAFSGGTTGKADLDPVDLLRWIDLHEAEHHK